MQIDIEKMLEEIVQHLYNCDTEMALDITNDIISKFEGVRDDLEGIDDAVSDFVNELRDNDNIKSYKIIINGREVDAKID